MIRLPFPLSATVLLLLALSFMLLGCVDERGGEAQSPDEPGDDASAAPNTEFLTFFNQQESLPAGAYRLVAVTPMPGNNGDFSIEVKVLTPNGIGMDDTLTGRWNDSAGMDPFDPANPRFDVVLHEPGGLYARIDSAVAGPCLVLLYNPSVQGHDTDTPYRQVIPPAGTGGCEQTIDMPASQIGSPGYAEAYYKAIDPPDMAIDTLEKWLEKNGFRRNDGRNRGTIVHLNDLVLGYGRRVHFRVNEDGSFAAYIDNFQVRSLPGVAYTDPEFNHLHREAALLNDRRHHIYTGAIEFSPVAAGGTCPDDCYVKFYAFLPAATPAQQQRVLAFDLDGSGERSFPGVCVHCHGGRLQPLRADGRFAADGDVGGQLLMYQVDRLEFDPSSPRSSQEAQLKELNTAIYCTYPDADPVVCEAIGMTPPTGSPGRWSGTFAKQILTGCYGEGFSSPTYGGSNGVCEPPAGWQFDPAADPIPPLNVEELFQQLVMPHCANCHAVQGLLIGAEDQNVDFSSWAKFNEYALAIQKLVYELGSMPSAKRNQDLFWNHPELPSLLAELVAYDGEADRPEYPLADAGSDRRIPAMPVRLSAGASVRANSFEWSIDSPEGTNASIEPTDSAYPLFAPDPALGDGQEYLLSLTVRQGTASSKDQLRVTIDSTQSNPSLLSFAEHIQPTLASSCSGCHQLQQSGPFVGIPVLFTEENQPEGTTLYDSVLSRVNFADPAGSLILTKPSGRQHGLGGIRDGFEPDGPRPLYHTFLNWILAGAAP